MPTRLPTCQCVGTLPPISLALLSPYLIWLGKPYTKTRLEITKNNQPSRSIATELARLAPEVTYIAVIMLFTVKSVLNAKRHSFRNLFQFSDSVNAFTTEYCDEENKNGCGTCERVKLYNTWWNVCGISICYISCANNRVWSPLLVLYL